MSGRHDLVVDAGATFTTTITAGRDLTGWELRGEIKLRATDPDPVYEWPTADLTAAGETVQLLIPAAVSAVWAWAAAVYQIDARSSDGATVARVASGGVVLNPWPIFPPTEEASLLYTPFYPPAYPQGA